MSRADIEKSVMLSLMALLDIAATNDCDYADAPKKEQPRPCPCPKCIARSTLDLLDTGPGNWRYLGAHAGRLQHSPRERKVVDAWRKLANDKTLGMILSETNDKGTYDNVEAPSVRDWYVATSVVQWLVTNVGMEVLRQAGFTYEGWDEDRKQRDLLAGEQPK